MESVIIRHKELLIDLMDPDFGLLDILHANGLLQKRTLDCIKLGPSTVQQRCERLISYTLENNKVQELLSALKSTNQLHLVNYINADGAYRSEFSEDWPLGENEMKRLQVNRPTLIEMIDDNGLYSLLLSKEVINKRQYDFISSKSNKSEKNEALLEIMYRFSIKQFWMCATCLREANQSHVAEILSKSGVAMGVHASLQGSSANVDEREETIVSGITNLLENSRISSEDWSRLSSLIELRLLAARKGSSVLLYFHCLTFDELQRLTELLVHGNLKRIVGGVFTQLLFSETTIEVSLTWSEEDFKRSSLYFSNNQQLDMLNRGVTPTAVSKTSKETKSTVSGETRDTSDVYDTPSAVEICQKSDAECEKDRKQDLSELHLAVERGDTKAVRRFLGSSTNVDEPDPEHNTLLHHAARCGNAEIVEYCISKGANINACNNDDVTPLHLACQNGHTSIVEILLDNHATVNVMKKKEDSPLYLAAKNGHVGVTELLLLRGVCDFVDRHDTPLQVAIKYRHREVYEVICKNSRTIYEKLTKDGETLEENEKRGAIPVELLSGNGRRFSAEIVWKEKITPLELNRSFGRMTPLVHATLSTDKKLVELLLSAVDSVYSETDIVDSFRSIINEITGLTDEALSVAREYNSIFRTVLRFLMDSSKFNVNHQNEYLNTFLHDLLRQYNQYSSCLYCTKELKRTRFALVQNIMNDIFHLLLEKGADFNLKNCFGETPLIIAAEAGCSDAIQILFEWDKKSGIKLNLNARDRRGSTALIKAVQSCHVAAVRLLLEHKASVNLYDYNGLAALHATVLDPNEKWFYLYFFCNDQRKKTFSKEKYSQTYDKKNFDWEEQRMCRITIFSRETIQDILDHRKIAARIRDEIVTLLLANDETHLNAIDFRGNTPLDLAVKSSEQITSETLSSLKRRGTIHKLLEVKDQTPSEVVWVDEKGRNPLHRLIISVNSYDGINEVMFPSPRGHKLGNVAEHIIKEILHRPENLRNFVTGTDYKGRTPLHYASLPFFWNYRRLSNLVIVSLKVGANVNAIDMYGKTPLHYAEGNDIYELFVKYEADEDVRDKDGHTPRDLKKLRDSMIINGINATKSSNVLQVLPFDIHRKCYTVTELTKERFLDHIRICPKSPRPQESSEEVIWNKWTNSQLFSLNRRLNQLEPPIRQLIDRLAESIKKRDGRYECKPILVGSAREETKAVIPGEFDFNFKLIKFGQLCDAFPHPLGPKGFFQLRRKSINKTQRVSDDAFDCFFNSDQCLLTNEVNSRFQITLEEVLCDQSFWENEHLFEMSVNVKNAGERHCKSLKLRMIRPIADGEGGFLFVNISVDIVACVHVDNWSSEDPLPAGLSSILNTDGCTFVFDRTRFDTRQLGHVYFPFSETFARISFSPLESRIIQESSPLIKAAYMICKRMLYDNQETSILLKTCMLFCIEALSARSGCETLNEDNITPERLDFWVERLIFCFLTFCRHNVYPCYFMPSFKQDATELREGSHVDVIDNTTVLRLRYYAVLDIYFDLCPDDTGIDIPVEFAFQISNHRRGVCARNDPWLEQFNREEFIKILSSRGSCS